MHILTSFLMRVKTVTTQISSIELNSELVNVAYVMGLNVSKTCEIAFKRSNEETTRLKFGFHQFSQRGDHRLLFFVFVWLLQHIVISVFGVFCGLDVGFFVWSD